MLETDVMKTRGLEDFSQRQMPNYPAEFVARSVVDMVATRAKAEKLKKPVEDVDPELMEQVFVRVHIPGENYPTEVVATPEHRDKWPMEWAAFTRGQSQQSGIPLSDWNRLEQAQVMHLNSIGIFSVQGLANAPDASLSAIGPFARKLRAEAREYLGRALAENAEKQRVAQDDRIRELEEKLERLTADAAGKRAAK